MSYGKFFLTSIMAAISVSGIAQADSSKSSTARDQIGFSNSYSGSSFRQVMNHSFERTAKQAVKQGIIGGYGLVSADNNVTEQASQIENMILQGYNAIIVLAGSDTALDGAVRDACDAGIKVVVFAGTVKAKCAYTVNYDWSKMGKREISYVAKRLNGKGNLLEIRGIAGDSTDAAISKSLHESAKQYPGLKFSGTVYGQWTQTVAQKAVATALPTLPKIDAVVDQGGDGFGAAQAFEAARRKVPIIIMGNRQEELAWWEKQHAETGYETMSLGATPSISQIAFWTAQEILAGKKVPKHITVPLLVIRQNDLKAWLSVTPKGGVANPTYSKALTSKIIEANANGQPLPEIPAPVVRNDIKPSSAQK